METVFVHIDSSIFIGKNFNFSGSDFKALVEWAKEDKIKIILTSITVEEVQSNISKAIDKSIQAIRKARKEARILKNLPLSIFTELDYSELEKEILGQFQKFINDSKADVLSLSDVDADHVFRLYFEKKAPFGLGKKKFEFPDAFILAAISLESEQESSPVYVISADKDFAAATENFKGVICIDSLEKYLSLVASHYEELAPLVTKLMEENQKNIKDAIKDQFLELGFYLGDQQGEVYDVKVNEIWGLEGYLISINNEIATFELTPTIEYTASISYDDLDTATYDSEDKVLIPWRKIDTEVQRSEILQVDMTIAFSPSDRSIFEIDEIEIMSPRQDVEVIAVDDE
ncbi:MAG: PIN domain-containing protein [Candidatus Electrothrix gigas]